MKKTQKRKTDSKFLQVENLDKIGEVAIYYGFSPFKSPSITKADLEVAKDILDGDSVDDETSKHGRLPLHVEEKIALIRFYHEQNMHTWSQPVMLYFKDPCRGESKKSIPRYADLEIMRR